MKIILDSLEEQLDERQFVKIKTAIRSGAIRKAIEKNKNHWLYVIKHDFHLLECELHYSVKSVRSAICSMCGPQQECDHVLIAAYWHIQHLHKIKKNEEKSREPKPYHLDQIKIFLEQTPKLKLEEILLRLAHIDLEARKLISLYTLPYSQHTQNESTKYENALAQFDVDSTGKTHSPKLNKSRLQSLEILYQTAISFFHDNQIIESFWINLALIDKISQWYYNPPSNPSFKVSQYNKKYHQLLYEIVHAIVAPEALDSILPSLQKVFLHPSYSVISAKENLLQIMMRKFATKHFTPVILHFLNQVLGSADKDLNSKLEASEFWLQKASTKEKEKPVIDFLSSQNYSSVQWHELLSQKQIQFSSQMIFMFEKSLKRVSDIKTRDLFIQVILQYYTGMGDLKKVENLARSEFLQSGSIKYVKILRESNIIQLEEYVDLLHEAYSKKVIQTEAYLMELQQIQKIGLLKDEILRLQSIDLVNLFAAQLIPAYTDEILLFYTDHCILYLQEHAGQEAYQYIENIKGKLKKYSKDKADVKLHLSLLQHFPERISLFQNA